MAAANKRFHSDDSKMFSPLAKYFAPGFGFHAPSCPELSKQEYERIEAIVGADS